MARIRDTLGALTCAAVLAAVLFITGTVSAHGTQAVSAVAPSESAAANQASARADAAALLGELSLPAGATESSSEPAGESVTFAWPALPGVLSTRSLVLTATQLPHGSTALRADAQVVWVTPRSSSDRIPAGARRLNVSVTSELKGNLAPQLPFSIGSAKRIEGVVALLNSLPAAQPGTRSCPEDPGIRVRLAFYPKSTASPLAVARIDPYGCGGVQLTIGGRPQPPLGRSVRSRAQPASSYEFEDLAITRQVAADGKPTSGFVSYFRLNRALPFAPRGKFEGEEEGGPRLFAAYLSVDDVHDEGATETMGDDASRHCYTEAIEVNAHEHQPRISELVNVSLVIHGRAVINTRTRVRTRKVGRSVRKPNGVLLNQTDLPYEKAFGCLKMSS